MKDKSIISLIVVNLITIVLAVIESWDFQILATIFIFQSLIIGFFHFIRVLIIKPINIVKPTKDYPEITKGIKVFLIIFIIFNFGMANLVLLNVFLKDVNPVQILNLPIILSVVFFFFNHLFSFLSNKETSIKLLDIIIKPYKRMLPMLFIFFVWSIIDKNVILTIFILTLKTIADVFSHVIEHGNFKNGGSLGSKNWRIRWGDAVKTQPQKNTKLSKKEISINLKL